MKNQRSLRCLKPKCRYLNLTKSLLFLNCCTLLLRSNSLLIISLTNDFQSCSPWVNGRTDFVHIFFDHLHLPLAELLSLVWCTLYVVTSSYLDHEWLSIIDLTGYIHWWSKRDQHFPSCRHCVQWIATCTEFSSGVTQLGKRTSQLFQLFINFGCKELKLL